MTRGPVVIMGVPRAHRIGGYERQAFRLEAALMSRGAVVRVVTHRLEAEPRREGDAAQVPLDSLPIPNRRGGRPALSCARYLMRQRRRLGRLVVHVHALDAFSFTLAYAAQTLRMPTLMKVATAGDIDRFCQSAHADRPVHRLGPRLRNVLRRCSAIVTLNAESEDEARRHLPDVPSRAVSFTNMVEIPEAASGASVGHEAGAVPADPVGRALAETRSLGLRCAVMINRLEARKNTLRLVRLWCDLPPRLRETWRLLVIGRGEEEEALRALLSGRGERSVVLLGEQMGHERWLGRMDLFILASEREGNPNGLMEAAASGARVLVTDIPGVGDCLPATARDAVFSLGEPRALESVGRERLQACLEAIGQRPGSSNDLQETSLRLFGPEVVCARYLALYDSLLRPRRRG
jgi:glycosyltransferase involved in cell wall biosynthesis